MPALRCFMPLFALLVAAVPSSGSAQAGDNEPFRYMRPPPPIARLVEAPARPYALLAPTRDRVALLERPAMPSIAELAEPSLGLAGQRINPKSNGPAGSASYAGVTFQPTAGGAPRRTRVPDGARLIAPAWSPDGRRLAFLLLFEDGVELWAAEAESGRARRVTGRNVNAAFPGAFAWLPDSRSLLVRLVPAGRGPAPEPSRVPSGPIVQETAGAVAPVATLQNLLAGPHDEALFEHYFTSQLAVAALDGGPAEPIGAPALFHSAIPSPDGRYVLAERLKRPFSYVVAASAFARDIVVLDRRGREVRRIADIALPEAVGGAPGSVRSEPRSVEWRADAPATLVWAEAQDDGPEVRDRVRALAAPFTGEPQRLLDLQHRYVTTLWGRDDFALVLASSSEQALEQRIAIDPSQPGRERLLQVRHFRGGADAGRPLTWVNVAGRDVLHFTPDGLGLFLEGRGGLLRLDLAGGTPTLVWREAPRESLFAAVDEAAERLLTWRETGSTPPNLFLVDRAGGAAARITDFADPAPEYAAVQRRALSYRRSDGVPLSGTLYLPAGYDPARDGPLPTLIWAYPRSFANVEAASIGGGGEDVSQSFVRPTGVSPLLLVTQGFAVLDHASMPIVGGDGFEPNDRYVEQLLANAEAAVEALVGAGVAEHGRIAVGGHSYGANMAASLLAHSDLFAAGMALSGAYNRTLTPFGFQASERRNLWEAPEAYMNLSPFMHADDIEEPILLVHGLADSNSATLPMQSERLFAALRGLGGTARLVLLPHEDHNYRARESVLHALWEMHSWLELHLRRPPAAATSRPLDAEAAGALPETTG